LVCDPTSSMPLRSSSVTSLMLCPHLNIATYSDLNHLPTPRYERRKFRNPRPIHRLAMQLTHAVTIRVDRVGALGPEWSTVTWDRP
jgi:hypothetical protein